MQLKTPVGVLTLSDSVHNTQSNEHRTSKSFKQPDGRDARLDIKIRWDDSLKNGHNTFAITATLYERHNGVMRDVAGGCLHEEIAEQAPELAFAIPFHLFSSDGPLHYFANTTYLAGDRDASGYRKDEQRRDHRSGLPLWQLSAPPFTILSRAEKPGIHEMPYEATIRAIQTDPLAEWQPIMGEGKERELALARRAACWPEALDDELMLPKKELEQLLAARLPALMARFKQAVEQLGFVY
jgi:hypothetical protein